MVWTFLINPATSRGSSSSTSATTALDYDEAAAEADAPQSLNAAFKHGTRVRDKWAGLLGDLGVVKDRRSEDEEAKRDDCDDDVDDLKKATKTTPNIIEGAASSSPTSSSPSKRATKSSPSSQGLPPRAPLVVAKAATRRRHKRGSYGASVDLGDVDADFSPPPAYVALLCGADDGLSFEASESDASPPEARTSAPAAGKDTKDDASASLDDDDDEPRRIGSLQTSETGWTRHGGLGASSGPETRTRRRLVAGTGPRGASLRREAPSSNTCAAESVLRPSGSSSSSSSARQQDQTVAPLLFKTPERRRQQEVNALRDETSLLLSRQPFRPSDLDVLRKIGKGAFGTIYLARVKDGGGALFAVKVLKKSRLLRHRGAAAALRERGVSRDVDHPFVVSLRCAFQSLTSLYLVVDYYPGGSLAETLKKRRRLAGADGFPLVHVRFFLAELILALAYLHGLGVAHRDVKPANVLVDARGHVALSDFGVSAHVISVVKRRQRQRSFKTEDSDGTGAARSLDSKESASSSKPTGGDDDAGPTTSSRSRSWGLSSDCKEEAEEDDQRGGGGGLFFRRRRRRRRRPGGGDSQRGGSFEDDSDSNSKHASERTFVSSGFDGTVAYMAPELLRADATEPSAAVDWWALGCTAYELFSGRTPFAASTPRQLFANILRGDVLPFDAPTVDDRAFETLLRGFLDRTPATRWDDKDARKAAFFRGLDWARVEARKVDPPRKPALPSFLTVDAAGNCVFKEDLGYADVVGKKTLKVPTVRSDESTPKVVSRRVAFDDCADFDDDGAETDDKALRANNLPGLGLIEGAAAATRREPRIAKFQGFAMAPTLELAATPDEYDSHAHRTLD